MFASQLLVWQNTFSGGELLLTSSRLIQVYINFSIVNIKHSKIKLGRQALYVEFAGKGSLLKLKHLKTKSGRHTLHVLFSWKGVK